MAYFNQQMKQEKAPIIKAILKKYGLKGSLRVYNHSSFNLLITEGGIDFLKNYKETLSKNRGYDNIEKITEPYVNIYWIEDHYSGVARDCLVELRSAMNKGNHDNSDAMTDYFDVGWYTDINIGKYEKPYKLIVDK